MFFSLLFTGNHESECHDPACVVNPRKLGLPLSNFTAYNARWKMPSQESGGVASMWYRCAMVVFVVCATYSF